jgi:hypothetical protein
VQLDRKTAKTAMAKRMLNFFITVNILFFEENQNIFQL